MGTAFSSAARVSDLPGYGSLEGFVPRQRKKQPVLVVDAEEMAKAHAAFQSDMADRLGAIDPEARPQRSATVFSLPPATPEEPVEEADNTPEDDLPNPAQLLELARLAEPDEDQAEPEAEPWWEAEAAAEPAPQPEPEPQVFAPEPFTQTLPGAEPEPEPEPVAELPENAWEPQPEPEPEPEPAPEPEALAQPTTPEPEWPANAPSPEPVETGWDRPAPEADSWNLGSAAEAPQPEVAPAPQRRFEDFTPPQNQLRARLLREDVSLANPVPSLWQRLWGALARRWRAWRGGR